MIQCPGMGSSVTPQMTSNRPTRADEIRPGEPCELSNGRLIECLPTGARGSRANLVGGSVLDTDPAVEAAGVDTGFSPHPGTMRAPDIAVGNIPDTAGWAKGAPPLAVEYADRGQDEAELAQKIIDLMEGGTRLVWVVRLQGKRRVEVHERGGVVRTVHPGEVLTAPGVLQNPVPVEALYDREAAHEATLQNLLQRKGFASVEQIQEEGRIGQARASLKRLITRRGLSLSAGDEARIAACADRATLERWFDQAVTASTTAEALH